MDVFRNISCFLSLPLPWQTMVRVWMNHRWLFLSPCLGVTGKPGWDCHLLSPRWQRAGTVKRTGRGKRIESGLPCGFLRETVSICSSGPNLTVNRFHYFLLYSTVCDLSMHLEHSLFLSKYRTFTFAFSVCTTLHALKHHELIVFGIVGPWKEFFFLFCFLAEVYPVFLTVHCNFHLELYSFLLSGL